MICPGVLVGLGAFFYVATDNVFGCFRPPSREGKKLERRDLAKHGFGGFW